MKKLRVFIGYDGRFGDAYKVAANSLMATASDSVSITPLLLPHLQAIGAYKRKILRVGDKLQDPISDAPMATEFALSRFLVPYLSGFTGYSVFCDSDFLFRHDIYDVFNYINPAAPLSCVHHKHLPDSTVKMDGCVQTSYPRKNWSSFMVFNNGHFVNRKLLPDYVGKQRGLALHQMEWADGYEIGELPVEWNALVGYNDDCNAKAAHFTDGTPDLVGYEDCKYADEWRGVLNACW